MTAPTHITFAEFIYLLILTTLGVSLNLVNAVVIAVSSLLPDIDTQSSIIGRTFPFISVRLERRFGHRTLTHSIPFILGIAVLTLPLLLCSSSLYACFISGYASHPFLDTMTVNGVRLFYPFSGAKCVFPFEVNNPHKYRIQTGSKGEKMLAALFFVGCIPTSMIAYEGYERFVRTAQQNIEAAVRDYNEFSKDHLVVARVVAHNAITKQPLSETVEIIGAVNPHTLIFKGSDSRLHTMGKEFQADFVVENILCSRGSAALSTLRNIDLRDQLLSQVFTYLDSSGENYLFGDLSTSEKISLPENIRMFTPITGEGRIIKLNYATYNDIRAFDIGHVFITKGILTIKSIFTSAAGKEGRAAVNAFPLPATIARIFFTLEAGESIEFLKQRGDSIRQDEVLARKGVERSYEGQIRLNRDRIEALLSQSRADLSALDLKIENTRLSAGIDSAEYAHNVELSKSHFASEEILESSRLKWEKELLVYKSLIASRVAIQRKSAIEVRKLELQNAQLNAKARSAAIKSEIRSSAEGLIIDIREVPHNEKTEITIIINVLPLPKLPTHPSGISSRLP